MTLLGEEEAFVGAVEQCCVCVCVWACFKYLLTHRLFCIIQAQGVNLRGDRRFPSRVSSRAREEEEEGEKVSCVRVCVCERVCVLGVWRI